MLSVGRGELLAQMRGELQFIDECGGVVFRRDAAFAPVVGEEPGFTETEIAGAFAGLDDACGAEIGPVEIRCFQDRQDVARLFLIRFDQTFSAVTVTKRMGGLATGCC